MILNHHKTINEMLIIIIPLIIHFLFCYYFQQFHLKLLNVEINNIIPPIMKIPGLKME